MTGLNVNDLVSLGGPLDPDGFGGRVGQIIRFERMPWGEGAQVVRITSDRSSGTAPHWVSIRELHRLDDATFDRWWELQCAPWLRGPRASTTPTPVSSSTWEERDLDRRVDRAAYLVALHDVLVRRWQAAGIVATPVTDDDQYLLFEEAS